jgi:hypothetical protein
MMPVLTKLQVDSITLSGNRPLLICDVDEVIVHFVREFEDFLDDQGFDLLISEAHLSGRTIQSRDGSGLLEVEKAYGLVADFFDQRTAAMQPIDGAVEAVSHLGEVADVIFLTNLPGEAGDARRANLASHGLNFPVITNTGPKGPAIRALADKTQGPVAFVDDSPHFLQSSFEYAPHVATVHFLQDHRFRPFTPHFDFLHHRSDNWVDTKSFLKGVLRG